MRIYYKLCQDLNITPKRGCAEVGMLIDRISFYSGCLYVWITVSRTSNTSLAEARAVGGNTSVQEIFQVRNVTAIIDNVTAMILKIRMIKMCLVCAWPLPTRPVSPGRVKGGHLYFPFLQHHAIGFTSRAFLWVGFQHLHKPRCLPTGT